MTGTSDPLSITTTNANDILLAGFRMSGTPSPTAGSGWTAIENQQYTLSEYQIVTSAGT
ncbi:hypothetical protein [Bradyrhizobium sp. NAS96.2]|uniref:hypothetical protein n=1 Tax=Bradyrhizobium sp. NAS96.2 TaxID=1680160 RepID=UPI00143DA443|nr:hypothetical protein [Bradyrhizobium sp. NAS96.2]